MLLTNDNINDIIKHKSDKRGGENMKLNRIEVNVIMARKELTVAKLADIYGVSRARMHVILNQREVTAACAGRIAKALGVDVTEILTDE